MTGGQVDTDRRTERHPGHVRTIDADDAKERRDLVGVTDS